MIAKLSELYISNDATYVQIAAYTTQKTETLLSVQNLGLLGKCSLTGLFPNQNSVLSFLST